MSEVETSTNYSISANEPLKNGQIHVLSESIEEDSDVDTNVVVITQKALLITAFNEPLSLGSIPVPTIGDYDILVLNKAVGLNPIDWKAKKYKFGVYGFPWINGRESSGVVVKVGLKVTHLVENDNVVVSSTSYRDNRTSTFQEYTAIDSRLVWKLPSFLSHEDGATIGVGLVTAGVIFYKSFGFELIANSIKKGQKTIVIWGGSTVVGIYVTQLARILGLKVISIAGLAHESYLKELGAHEVIDRHLTSEEIKTKIHGRVDYGVDCVSRETSQILLDILADKSALSPHTHRPLFSGIVGIPKEIPPEVELREVIIKQFHEDVQFGKKFVDVTAEFLEAKLIKPVRYKGYQGGLHLIDNGLADLENLGARGEKYVVSFH